MRLVSFDPFRTLSLPGVRYVKPERYLDRLPEILEADWLLFPEYWQVNALHYAYGKRIFPSLASYHLGHDKIEMTRVLEGRWGSCLPRTVIAASVPSERARILDELGLPLVAKAPRSSEGRGVKLIETEADWLDWCAANAVLYAQEYLPIDRDLRLVVVGRRVVAGYWRLGSDGGFLNNLAAGGRIAFDPVPPEAVRLVRDIARSLAIDHAGFDVAWVDGHPYVLEFNRLFGNAGLRELGVDTGPLIHAYLASRRGGRPRGGAPRHAA